MSVRYRVTARFHTDNGKRHHAELNTEEEAIAIFDALASDPNIYSVALYEPGETCPSVYERVGITRLYEVERQQLRPGRAA